MNMAGLLPGLLLCVVVQLCNSSPAHLSRRQAEQCAAAEEDRQQCGKKTFEELTCRSRGCCFEECEGCAADIPWCFMAARMVTSECQVTYTDKDDCGYYGISEGECLMRGCCWAPSPIVNDAHCFHKKAGQVRLVGGEDGSSGRVEIQHDGEWGTVCDDDFDDREASVVCRGLGYPYGVAFPAAHFGSGDGQIWLDDMQCSGDEESLADCSIPDGWGNHNCDHSEDAGVRCGNEPMTSAFTPTPPSPSRPVGGPCPNGWRWLDGECLKFFHDIVDNTPDQAEGVCAENGGTVVVIDSQQKTNAIVQLFPEEEYFCFPGMQRRGGTWVYADGSPITYTNWREWPPEPQGDGDCIAVLWDVGGEWNDVPCMSHCGSVILCSMPDGEEWGEGGPPDYMGPGLCPPGFTLAVETAECMMYVHDVSDNSDVHAQETCQQETFGLGSVVRIDSQQKSDMIARLFPNEEYFCFPDIKNRGGRWTYSDGQPAAWTNWRTYPPEPQGDGACVSVLWVEGGVWNDVPCTHHCGTVILCALPMVPPTPAIYYDI